MGENRIVDIIKEFAWVSTTGIKLPTLATANWETTAVTNTDKGVLLVLMKSARHKHLNRKVHYQLENENMLHSYQKAMVGKHVMKPTNENQAMKKALCMSIQ
jgi:hypothetical protein